MGSLAIAADFEEAATERLLEEIAGNYSQELSQLKVADFSPMFGDSFLRC